MSDNYKDEFKDRTNYSARCRESNCKLCKNKSGNCTCDCHPKIGDSIRVVVKQ